MTGQPSSIGRVPYCTKVRYGVSGAPVLTDDEMDGSHAPGVGVRPALIELVYSQARDGKPASVSVAVTGEWMRFGQRDGGEVTTHFAGSVEDWPAWLAEEARLHDPDAVPVSSPPPDQTALRDRIAEALAPYFANFSDWETARINAGEAAAGVLAVVPPSADRAAVLREAAAAIEAEQDREEATELARFGELDHETELGRGYVLASAALLRRLAAEAQQPDTETQAHPPIHAWRVETRDPGNAQWTPGSHFAHRPNAVERLDTANRTAPLWNDGTPVERRIVRETTTYTVEEQPPTAPSPESGRV